jgi:hypothetical protein
MSHRRREDPGRFLPDQLSSLAQNDGTNDRQVPFGFLDRQDQIYQAKDRGASHQRISPAFWSDEVSGPDPSAVDEALEFVRKAIDGQAWVRSTELYELGQTHGFQRKAIRRAAARLGYRAKKKGYGHGGYRIFKTTDPDFKEGLRMSEAEPDDKDDYYGSD